MADYCMSCGQAYDQFSGPIERHGITIDHDGLHYGEDTPIHLTRHERDMLRLLMVKGRVSREMLELHLFNDHDSSDKMISVYIYRLRTKLKNLPIKIINLWGFGYQLNHS